MDGGGGDLGGLRVLLPVIFLEEMTDGIFPLFVVKQPSVSL